MTYPDGAVVDYVRDGQGRIQEIGVKPASGVRTVLLNNATYEPFGPASGWTYGNGRTLSRSYDLNYRPKAVFDNASGGLSLGYGYNTVGELTTLKDGLQSTTQATYDYDALSRLTVTRQPSDDALETYSYDKTENRTSLRRGTTTPDAYTYPWSNHRLGAVAGVARGYDAVGNTTSIGGAAREFVYDSSDRLSQVKQSGVVKAGYRYNAMGQRVAVENGAGSPLTYTLYDESGNWIGEYDANGLAQQQAVWMKDAPAGLLVGSGSAQTLMYVETDHLGTPRAVIDPTRNTAVWTWSAKSEVFGNDLPNQDPDLDGNTFVFNMRFPGQRFDAASGLVYNYFRDYDTASGRYLQSDPIGLRGGLALYSYAGASPVMTVDPLGLKPRIYVNGNSITIIEPVNFGIDPRVTPEAARRAFEEAEKVWTKKVGKCNVRMRIIDGRNDPSAVKVQLRRLDLYEINNMNNWYIPNPSDGHYWKTFDWSTFGHEVGHDLLNYPDNLAPRKERPTVMGTDYTTVPAFSVSAWDIARLLERWTDEECECN